MTTIAFIGDVMLGRGVNEELGRVRPETIWGTTLPLLRGADAVIANLECAITEETKPWTRTPRLFHFRADPAGARALRTANVRCVSLANNHSLDYEEQGLLDTLMHLETMGIAHAGAGVNLARASAPAIVRLPDLSLAVVALTDQEPAFAATASTIGTSCFASLTSGAAAVAAPLADLAAACRKRGTDLAVLSLHWGPHAITAPPPRARKFAQAAIDAGFDVIHGHSAHVVHGIEIYRGRPIFYDCGDFLDDYLVDEQLHNDWSFLFLVDVVAKRIATVRLIPLQLGYARVDLAKGADAEAMCRRMREHCTILGTDVRTRDGALEISCETREVRTAVYA